ncbi:MAG: butyrate kinase [Syntrophales bacterium]
MDKAKGILAINVGSTSTKVAFFRNAEPVVQETIKYSAEELASYPDLRDQLPKREEDLRQFLQRHRISLNDIDMVISRGGVGKPAPAGAYKINEAMREDLLEGRYGKHPSALGPAMALEMSEKYGKPAIVIDPPSTDEFHPIARFSGIPEIERKSAFHALNQKMAARRAARDLGKEYKEIDLVVAHLGGGITIGAHRKGRVVDCTHGLSEGPFTPERAGSLPTQDLVDLAFSGKMDKKQLLGRLIGRGGLAAYIGTNDAQKVESMIRQGDKNAENVYRAMAYQIAKDIGAMSVVLQRKPDAVVLTGGLAFSKILTDWIREMISFLAPVLVYPGEDEMIALAEGALRVMQGTEEVKEY